MDTLFALWTFAPDIKVKLVCVALFLQLAITMRSYTLMVGARIKAAKSGKVEVDQYKATVNEPEEVRVFTRAVANQFEMPVMFYALVIAGLAVSATSWIAVILAFVYVLLRYMHMQEMTGENRVLKRRRIFIRSAQVIMLLMVDFLVSALLVAQA